MCISCGRDKKDNGEHLQTNYNVTDFRNIFINRSITRTFEDENYFLYSISNSIVILYNCNFDLNDYDIRINCLYLGKYLTKTKYSSINNETIVTTPKSALLTIILLCMCGDTGALINPGPISPLEVHTGDTNVSERYLEDIDPDMNYFDDTEYNTAHFRSYTIDEFKDIKICTSETFNIMHHNCRSILSKDKLGNYVDFLDLLDDPFDIIGLSETWLKDHNVNSPIFKDYNYKHVYETRQPGTRGGGLSLFIRDTISFKKRNDLSVLTPYLELLFVELTLNEKTYLIGVTYRIPNTNIKLFTDGINEILEPIRNTYNIILMGDFNICLLQDNKHSEAFRNTMQSNSLFPTILEPTRVTTVNREGQRVVTESLIDNIYVNDSLTYKSGIIYSDISDHYPIFISIPKKSTNVNTDPLQFKFRLIDEFRIRKFKSVFTNNSYIQAIMHMESAEAAFATFFNTFNQLYDKYFPIITKNVTKKTLLKPWITNTMIEQIKHKHSLARLVDKGRIDKKSYTDFKNKLTKDLREAKAKYYASEFTKNEGDIRGTWKIINKNIKNQVRSKQVVIKKNGVILDQKEVPYKFIDYFINIPYKLVSKIIPVNINASFYFKNRSHNSFFISPVIDKDIETAIKNLKSSNGIHTISTLVLKEIAPVISEPLSYILNLCINQGYFPGELKTGCITPIFKKGDQYNIENYRPVCSLSQFSKIFEKIIYNQMINYITKNGIISNSQYGFQQNKSTESALIDLTDFIHQGLTERFNVGAVFMDLSKAFDVMNHDILYSKLEHYGFRGRFLSFIMNFLKDRKYFVCTNGYQSDARTSNIGVPQGSTLGPLLFLLYINDIENCSALLKFILFADDTTVLFRSHDINELNDKLTAEINKVNKWFSANNLLINLSKTNCMLFSNKLGNPKLNISIDNMVLEEKYVVTFLGVEVDRKLTWKNHIDHICNKISKSVAILRILRYSFPKPILLMIYMSLIHSYINYCNVIWGSAYECHLKPLIVLQKKAVRLITNSNFRDASAPIFYDLKLLPVSKVFHLNCLQFLYKCLNNNSFPAIRQRILHHGSSHDHATRNKDLLKLPKERLEICKNACLYQSISLWNNLDTSIKESKSLLSFKYRIKHFLIEQTRPALITSQ